MFHFDSLGRDMRFAWRSFLKNPGFSVVAILALALGIGANSAMFSVVDAILLKPLPYAKPEQLVWLTQNIPMFKAEMATSIDYWEWRDQKQLFDDVAAYSSDDFNLVGSEPERVRVAGVTANFFRTFGLSPSLGRTFTEDEDAEDPRNRHPHGSGRGKERCAEDDCGAGREAGDTRPGDGARRSVGRDEAA